MEEKRFKEGDKVYWNAGWNNSPSYAYGGTTPPYGWMLRGPYDFGYYSQTEGKVILYEEGERSMQDSFCVSECYVISEREYRYVRGIEKWEK